MAGVGDTQRRPAEKADRRAARQLIFAYHQTQLRVLLEHVRAGFAKLDEGEIDEFELDDLIHHYKRSAAQLWKFCGPSGGQWQQAVSALTYIREQGEEPDWWERGATASQSIIVICIDQHYDSSSSCCTRTRCR